VRLNEVANMTLYVIVMARALCSLEPQHTASPEIAILWQDVSSFAQKAFKLTFISQSLMHHLEHLLDPQPSSGILHSQRRLRRDDLDVPPKCPRGTLHTNISYATA
jgi:hypothetical protein